MRESEYCCRNPKAIPRTAEANASVDSVPGCFVIDLVRETITIGSSGWRRSKFSGCKKFWPPRIEHVRVRFPSGPRKPLGNELQFVPNSVIQTYLVPLELECGRWELAPRPRFSSSVFARESHDKSVPTDPRRRSA